MAAVLFIFGSMLRRKITYQSSNVDSWEATILQAPSILEKTTETVTGGSGFESGPFANERTLNI